MIYIAIVLAVVTGLAMAAQSPTNAALGSVVGTLQASFTNFVVGTAACALMVVALGDGNLALVTTVPFWQLIGGVYGVIIIVALVIATPRLGVVLMVTMTMLGQLMGGMVIDSFGLAGAAVVAVSPLRLVGCAFVCAGIICVHMGNRTGGGSEQSTGRLLLFMALPFVAGFVSTLQPPTNAALSATVGTLEASLVNFIGGTLLIAVVTLIATRGKLVGYSGTKPWQLMGGFYGAAGVALAAAFSPVLGVSLWMAGTMLGQLAGGMVADTFGLFGVPKITVNLHRVAGALLIVAGIAVVTIAKLG